MSTKTRRPLAACSRMVARAVAAPITAYRITAPVPKGVDPREVEFAGPDEVQLAGLLIRAYERAGATAREMLPRNVSGVLASAVLGGSDAAAEWSAYADYLANAYQQLASGAVAGPIADGWTDFVRKLQVIAPKGIAAPPR